MKKTLASLVMLFCCFALRAQKFDWNVAFDYHLANYEYLRSLDTYDDSYTLHAARLVPEAGLLLGNGGNVIHRVRAGVELFRQMGEGLDPASLVGDVLFYYDIDAAFRSGGRLEALAGCFPRRVSEAEWIGPFFDDDVYFLDNNIEGMFFKYRNKRLYAELSLDWPGMLGDDEHFGRMERFQILSAGSWNFARDFSLRWNASFYHYHAYFPESPNVVDNHMVCPRLEWAPGTFFDACSVDAGVLLTYQCNRSQGIHPLLPMGFMSCQRIGKWKLRLDNRFYFGDDLMPFFDVEYAGKAFGRELYYGDRGFHTLHASPSWADWLDFVYEPEIARWLNLRLAMSFRFGEPPAGESLPVFRGWQQTLSLRFDLDSLRPSPKRPARERGGNKPRQSFIL